MIPQGRKIDRADPPVAIVVEGSRSPVESVSIKGTMVIGLGIFRYQRVASPAREASRLASVRGSTDQGEQSKAAPTDQEVLTEMLKRAVIPDRNALTFHLDPQKFASGTAAVTVTYRWTPEAFFAPITMTSTSQVQVQY